MNKTMSTLQRDLGLGYLGLVRINLNELLKRIRMHLPFGFGFGEITSAVLYILYIQ